MEEIRVIPTPKECKATARGEYGNMRKRREDWPKVKDEVMYTALKAKFTQHLQLRKFLLDTGHRYLAEHTENDKYWGDGGDGSGINKSGELLMKLRDEFRSEEKLQKDESSGDSILFYGSKLPYYEFSNFYPSEIKILDKEYPTTEHYFQALKFHPDEKLMEKVRLSKSPGVAAKHGRDRKNPLRKDWEEVKDEIMFTALRAKFTQHETLKKVLLETGDKIIIEHTKNDFYWADGGDGSGKNKLGILLMKLRDELK
jgi:N-glycosidase YbiA